MRLDDIAIKQPLSPAAATRGLPSRTLPCPTSPTLFSFTRSATSIRAMASSVAAPLSSFHKVQIHKDDNTAFDSYVVGKESAAPGIVVLQEWWGVNYEIKNHALYISQLHPGYRELIPDLFRRKVGLDVAEAHYLMEGLDWQGVVKDIHASIKWLKAVGLKRLV